MHSSPQPKIKQINFPLGITGIYYFFYLATGLLGASIGPSLQSIAQNTSTELSQLGFLFTALSAGRMCGAFILHPLYKKITSHLLMFFFLIGAGIGLALTPQLTQLLLVALVLFIIGVFWGGLDVGVNTNITLIWKDKSSFYLNGLHLFYGIGAFIAPLVVIGAVNTLHSFKYAYWFFGFLFFFISLILVWLPSPITKNNDQALKENGSSPFKWLAGIFIFIVLCVGIEVSFGGWIYSYLTEKELVNENQAALLNSLYWAFLTLGRLLVTLFSNKLKSFDILIFDLIGCMLAMIAILLFPESVFVAWGAVCLIGFSIATIFPTTIIFTSEHMTITHKITSTLFIADSIGGMGIPWITGALLGVFGPSAIMSIILISAFFAMLIILWVKNQPIQPSLPSNSVL